jgi:hypothetical protein
MAISKNKQRYKSSVGGNAAVAMIGGRKLTFSPDILKKLGISKESIGKNSAGRDGIAIELDMETKELVLYKVSKSEGYIIGGTFSKPETYCADFCKEMLKIMGKTLTNAGTVNFPSIKEDYFEEDKTPCIIVNVDKYTAKPGVFINEEGGKQ